MPQQKTVAHGPSRADVNELVGLYEAGRLRDLERRAKKLARRFPQAVILLELLGAALAGQGKLADAVACFQRIAKASPSNPDAHYNLGLALHQIGRHEAAVSSYRKALELNSSNPVAQSNLGISLAELERFDEAVDAYRAAIATAPEHAEAYSNIGIALKRLGRTEEAIEAYQQALKLRPDFAEAHNNLGNLLREMSRNEEALSHFEEAVVANPEFESALVNRAETLRSLGRHQEATKAYAEAARLNPADAKIQLGLAACLRQQGRLEEAETCARAVVDADRSNAAAHLMLSTVLQYQGRYGEAADACTEVTRLQPSNAGAFRLLADICELNSQLKEAREAVKESLRLEPANPGAVRILATLLRREGKVDEAIAALEPVQHEAVSDVDRVGIHSELGQLYDRQHESTKAFEQFSQANAIQAESDPTAAASKVMFRDQVLHALEVVEDKWVRSWKHADPPPEIDTPAFVVGFPRSGTTLIDQILDAHPAIQVMEEPKILADMMPDIAQSSTPFPEILAELDRVRLDELRAAYFRGAEKYVAREPGTLLIEKTPLNICNIPLIIRLFPAARVVLCLRHPCDVVLSCFMQAFALNPAMANFLTLPDSAVLYADVMSLWQKCQSHIPMQHHAIRYEDLLADFDTEVTALLDFLGVGWDESVREFSERAKARQIRTPSYQGVTEGLYTRAQYRWKRYEEQMAGVMDELQPFVDAFGYGE